ncbi:MAG: DnaJ domain-containing protein [Desulfobulbaceae bacterium]|nr:DnaJ domain-containing protein [Desulfobulbaceae bacterium]
MKTPYEILEVSEDADDTAIKKAYLAMVRHYPPERFPDDFQRIYQAYELLKTAEDRLSYRLFHCSLPERADIATLLLSQDGVKNPPTKEEFQNKLARDIQNFCAGLVI